MKSVFVVGLILLLVVVSSVEATRRFTSGGGNNHEIVQTDWMDALCQYGKSPARHYPLGQCRQDREHDRSQKLECAPEIPGSYCLEVTEFHLLIDSIPQPCSDWHNALTAPKMCDTCLTRRKHHPHNKNNKNKKKKKKKRESLFLEEHEKKNKNSYGDDDIEYLMIKNCSDANSTITLKTQCNHDCTVCGSTEIVDTKSCQKNDQEHIALLYGVPKRCGNRILTAYFDSLNCSGRPAHLTTTFTGMCYSQRGFFHSTQYQCSP